MPRILIQMTASVISCPIDETTKKKIDILCGLKKIHQYEFISGAIDDKLKKENVDSILDKYEEELKQENDSSESHGFFGKLRSIYDIG